MLRLNGVVERRDKTFYDTHLVEPGNDVRMFGNANVGDWRKSNMQIAGCVASDQPFFMLALGARCVGRSRAEEDLLLDHVHLTLYLGDRPMVEVFGPHASMLRHVFTDREAERMGLELDDLNRWCDDAKTVEHDFDRARCRRCARHIDSLPTFPAHRVGHHLIRPVVFPVRQNFHVKARATRWITEPVVLRVHLFGVLRREVT